jgi:sugar/nucleoside kinase (ribokinase family)
VKKSRFDVLVIGSPCVDLVFGGLPHWPVLGQEMYVASFGIGVGAVFNTAATLSRLGLRVALLCELGNDFFSRYILEEIDRVGICRDLIIISDRPTFTVSVCLAYESERGFVSYTSGQRGVVPHMSESPSSNGHLKDESADEPWIHESHQLLAEYDFEAVFMHARPAILPLLDIMNRRGTTVFFDTGWHPQVLSHTLMPAIVKRGHFIMPNQLEATFMTGTQKAEDAACKLAEWAPTAIVKMGANGAIACHHGKFTYCPAFPVKEAVDTTGAGDAFNAGFIYGVLRGYSLPEALRCGTICGGLSITALTGTAAVPTVEELERLLRI